MIPEPSVQELEERLRHFRARTGYTIVVLTMPSLEDEEFESLRPRAVAGLGLAQEDLEKTVLLWIAVKERAARVQVGAELASFFPEPAASRKMQEQVNLYLNGLRRDLGIHGAVHYIFGVIDGRFRLDRATEEEKLEQRSLSGGGAGAILSLFLAPFLAFVVGVLWGIYATNLGVESGPRLFMGALLGGGAAKIVEILMSQISGFGVGLWYFLIAVSMVLGAFGSLTEYWMAGSDWSGIPRLKDGSLSRKPTDKMGI